VAPSLTVGVSASVNAFLHHKLQKFSSGTGTPGWFRKKGRKTVVVVIVHDVAHSSSSSSLRVPVLRRRSYQSVSGVKLISIDDV